MSIPFRWIHVVSIFPSSSLIGSLLGNMRGREDGCRLFTTWRMTGHGLLSHSGYVSIYDIKVDYPITALYRRVPWEGARAHLCPSLFLFFLSFARAVVFLSLSFSLCREICRNVLFTALKNISHHPFLLFIVSFFPSSYCNILVFTVVFLPCIYKAVLTIK